MQSLHRICALMLILALSFGPAANSVYAGGMMEDMVMSASDPMQDRPTQDHGCAACETDDGMALCAATLCASFPAVLTPSPALLARHAVAYPWPADQTGSGRTLFPDTGPPRTIVIG